MKFNIRLSIFKIAKAKFEKQKQDRLDAMIKAAQAIEDKQLKHINNNYNVTMTNPCKEINMSSIRGTTINAVYIDEITDYDINFDNL